MKRKYLILFSLTGLVLCLDQLSKFLVYTSLKEGESRVLAGNFLSIVHTRNNGFAFGLLQKAPASMQDIFFVAVPIFALILILLIFIKLRDGQMITSIALTLILGGAVGNLVDRVQYGYVIDFLRIHWQNRIHVAAFNLADIAIVTGVVLMFVNTLKQGR